MGGKRERSQKFAHNFGMKKGVLNSIKTGNVAVRPILKVGIVSKLEN